MFPAPVMSVSHCVLYAVCLLGAFCVIEAVERSNEIARNAPYALERLACKVICGVDINAVNLKVYSSKNPVCIFFLCAFNILLNFSLRERPARYLNIYHYLSLPVVLLYF